MGGGKDGTIQVWDLKTRKHKKTYEVIKDYIVNFMCGICRHTYATTFISNVVHVLYGISRNDVILDVVLPHNFFIAESQG